MPGHLQRGREKVFNDMLCAEQNKARAAGLNAYPNPPSRGQQGDKRRAPHTHHTPLKLAAGKPPLSVRQCGGIMVLAGLFLVNAGMLSSLHFTSVGHEAHHRHAAPLTMTRSSHSYGSDGHNSLRSGGGAGGSGGGDSRWDLSNWGGQQQGQDQLAGDFGDGGTSSRAKPKPRRDTSDSCLHANDGTCDEPEYCDVGTDTADCKWAGGLVGPADDPAAPGDAGDAGAADEPGFQWRVSDAGGGGGGTDSDAEDSMEGVDEVGRQCRRWHSDYSIRPASVAPAPGPHPGPRRTTPTLRAPCARPLHPPPAATTPTRATSCLMREIPTRARP